MTFTNRLTESGPPLTEAEIEHVEQTIGRPFPADFRRLYRAFNGGVPERNYYAEGLDGFIEYEVQFFFPMLHGTETIEAKHRDLVQTRKLLPADVVPFAVGTGGDFYCLNASDEVVFVPMDSVSQRPQRVARSIAEFVNGMVTSEELYG